VRADPAGTVAVDRVRAADDRAAAPGADPGRGAISHCFQPFPVPPDGCLGLAQVLDPRGQVFGTREPDDFGEFGVRPVLCGDALGEYDLDHAPYRVVSRRETVRPWGTSSGHGFSPWNESIRYGTGPGAAAVSSSWDAGSAGPWLWLASRRAAILAAACELVSGGSSAASAAAHALRPCSRDTRPGSWIWQTSSAFFSGGSASLGACGAGDPADDVPFEGFGMLGESPVGELGVMGLS